MRGRTKLVIQFMGRTIGRHRAPRQAPWRGVAAVPILLEIDLIFNPILVESFQYLSVNLE
jgi:hypothetical protein